mmetsp:Transcript_8842/g.20461  ORF Transcript_8842/g.20461 Transcript_8842/m.20461 type:complete len:91 (+) Transcript_8842:392-664(+)
MQMSPAGSLQESRCSSIFLENDFTTPTSNISTRQLHSLEATSVVDSSPAWHLWRRVVCRLGHIALVIICELELIYLTQALNPKTMVSCYR